MIAGGLRFSPALIRAIQFSLLVVSILAAGGFLRHSLVSSADSFVEDFRRQAFLELAKGETFVVARKLAALAKGDQFRCVRAEKQGIVFFEEATGPCDPSLFQVVREVAEPNQGITIAFSLRMQDELLWAFWSFVAAQGLLGVSLVLLQRQSWLAMHAKDFAAAAMARQVGHDIRSPLAVLKASRLASGPGPEGRALARLAALVRNLLGESAAERRVALGGLLAEAVEEKRAEHGEQFQAQLMVPASLERLRLPGDGFFWARLVSNLLNNAFEARSGEVARVEVSAERLRDSVAIQIADSGRGLAPEVLARLGESGFSYQKPGGMGLGISSAMAFLQSVGGRLSFRAGRERGLVVTIQLPQAGRVVLIDDDAALGQLWRAAAASVGLELVHYASWAAFSAGRGAHGPDTAIYLDVEFAGQRLDLAMAGKQLQGWGFHDLHLATGHPASSFAALKWPRTISGKEPPWI